MTSRFDATTTTTCGYCGVGCRLEAHRADGRITSISPAMDGPANKGHTCVKGRFAHQFARSRDRLTAPLVRESGGFRLASWEEAIGAHRRRLRAHQVRARPRRDRRARLLARDQRGLLRDAAPDARRDRHAQHRQLLARLPLAHVVGAAQVVRHVGRHRLVRRHRGRRGGAADRRQPDPGPPGRGRAHQAGGDQGPEADHRRPAPHRAGRLRPAAPRHPARAPTPRC